MRPSAAPDGTVRVWDPLVRIGHWSLVAAVAGAWITGEGFGAVHEWIGYAALVVVAIRLVWGFVGTRYARFTQFVRLPAATLAYARAVVAGREPRHVGHNPLGAWMIVALVVVVVLTGGTGWLYTTDRFWGVEWVEDLHEGLATLLLWLIALHVAGAVFESVRHGENLVRAMFTGDKRAPGPEDVA